MNVSNLLYLQISRSTKRLSFFNRYHEHFLSCFLVSVLGEIKLVEASVGLGQALATSLDLDDLELAEAVRATEAFESFDRDFAAAGHELDEFSKLVVSQLLQGGPEEEDWLRTSCIVLVGAVLLEIVDVDRWQTRKQQLKLSVVKNLKQITGHNREEALQEGIHLGFDCLIQSESGNSLHIVDLVLIRHKHIGSIRNQLHLSLRPEEVKRLNEILTDVLDVCILQEPVHRFV